MAGLALSSANASTLVILALIVLLIGRRIVLMVRGAPVRPFQMFAIAALLVALFAFALAFSFSELPAWTYAVDGVILVVATVLATRWVRRRVVLQWVRGAWTYRLGALIPAVYLVLFVVRLALEFLGLGGNPFAGSPPGTAPLAGLALVVVTVVNALFAFSTGLLAGRTVGVYLEYRKLPAGGPVPAPSGAPGATRLP
jgi:hypothetical protein